MISQFVRVLPTVAYLYGKLEEEINRVLEEPGTRVVGIHVIACVRPGFDIVHETIVVFEQDRSAALRDVLGSPVPPPRT